MTTETFAKIVDRQIELCRNMLIKKNEEYTNDKSDRFHTFKVAAELTGETQMEALAGMMVKHTVSIYDMCKSGDCSLEKWDEKITDHINYLLLLKAMAEEKL